MIDKPIRAPGESLTMFAARLEVYDNRVETMRNAAPDLVEALAALLAEVDAMTKRVGWAGNGGRDKAAAALAKAGVL